MIIQKISNGINRNIDEARGGDNKPNKLLKNLDSRIAKKDEFKNHYQKIAHYLKIKGNPYKLTPVSYYMIKIGLALIVFTRIMTYKNELLIMIFRSRFISAIFLSVIGYFAVDMLYYLNNKDDNKRIKQDLPDVYDSLNIQTSGGVELGLALTEVYDVPSKSKRLRKHLGELAAEINITKNPYVALKHFASNFDGSDEIDIFVYTVAQSLQTGKSEEAFDGQSEILKTNNIFMVQEQTKEIKSYLFMIGVLIFLGVSALIVFSFVNQIGSNLDQIFN